LRAVHKTASSIDYFQVSFSDFRGDFRSHTVSTDSNSTAFDVVNCSGDADAKACEPL
jgi:hypothetical protein